MRTPWSTIIIFPFSFESLAVASSVPELRLLEIETFHSGIDDPFDLGLFEILKVILRRDDVGDHFAVPDGVTVRLPLSLVQMRLPVPFSCEVILVSAPSYSGHEIHPVTPLSPGSDPVLDSGFTVRAVLVKWFAGTVDHRRVSAGVYRRLPDARGLECCLDIGAWILRLCG